ETAEAVKALAELCAERDRVVVFSDNRAESERLEALVSESCGRLPPELGLRVGRISGGFDWPATGLAVVSERELLGRYRQRRRVRARAALPGIPVESLADLVPGDYVVHRVHGIGRYLGMEAIEKGGRLEEHLELLYADDVRLYVPAANVDLVARYLAPGGSRPDLSRIGSKRWAEKTKRARAAVRDIAAELIELAAARARQAGVACPPGEEWERHFVESFPYEDTPDQSAAWTAVRDDLESPRPADRLLCGDVGFGKTEVAVRASFKTSTAGHQVAVLVPTTLLAEQHGRTFRERMADYPLRVEVLSRFRTGSQQRAILEGMAAGTVDVVIGTHRLLQPDVAFRDIGLVIIDEEQRFGVLHKEKLKRLRASVNVLTLTATPIPRTLHMAMLGLRDISSLGTAPADRLSVRTRAARWNDDLIRRATLRELARDGQVYFVHNRVHSIARVAERLEKLVPEARLAVAHGQMTENELDRAMSDFLERRADVLVSTVIIESGLDIPSVNTIFIDRADRFGLADLHQLRGRVGRYLHRAYCYLLIPPEEMISGEALARVKALEEFSDLGAGFRLAMRDLELRGAGNILGARQSGHLEAVGYDLYARLLERTARELRGEEVPEDWECSVHLADRALIPEEYLPDESSRLEVYRRLASCRDDAAVDALAADLADRFGRPPAEVERMTAEARVRVRARAARASAVAVEDGRLLIRFFGREAREAAAKLKRAGRPRFPHADTLTLAVPRKAETTDGLLAWAREVLEALSD
ncbi:MAG: transcription-repair coupling factor, partial [Planctomycetota bacterium]